MKTIFSLSNPAEVETECLVAIVLDRAEKNRGEKDKSLQVSIETTDAAVKDAAADVIAGGEVTGKTFETTLLHRPAKLKAKRLLLLGGGKAKSFSAFDLRRLAGAAVRTLKSKGLRSFAFLAPEAGLKTEDAVKAIVEGAFVGNFDPDYYKSDRKDQKIDALTVVARGDQAKLQAALDEARIVGESQNFTRDLVNEPSNRMTPTILADRAKKMAAEVGLEVRSLRRGQDQGTEDGRLLERRPGLGRTARADRHALRTRRRSGKTRARTGRQRHHLRHRRHFHQAQPTAWRR